MDGKMDLSTQDPVQYLGPHGKLDYYTNKYGLKIAAYYWPAHTEKVKAVIHWTHGHGSYLPFDVLKTRGPGSFGTYSGSWVEALNKAGYSVCGVDNQGSGRSEPMSGERCYCNSFDEYVDNVVEHIQLVPKLQLPGFPPFKLTPSTDKTSTDASAELSSTAPTAAAPAGGQHGSPAGLEGAAPRFMVGLSMGACLATLVGLRLAGEGVVSGVVLLGPMLSLERVAKRGINQLLRVVAPVVSGAFPKWKVVKVSRNTLYPDLQATYDADPNCWHENTRARNGFEYNRVTTWLMRGGGMESVTFPFITFHGEQDDMCDPDGSKALYARAKSTDKTLRLLSHMWHILTKEPGNEGVLADIIEWLDARTATAAGAPPDANEALIAQLRAAAAEGMAGSKMARLLSNGNSTAAAAAAQAATATSGAPADAAAATLDAAADAAIAAEEKAGATPAGQVAVEAASRA